MIGFTVIGIGVCVIFGTLFIGAVISAIVTFEKNSNNFYTFMFFWSWVLSTLCLIAKLTEPLLNE